MLAFIGLAILLVACMKQVGLALLGVIFGAYGQEMTLKVSAWFAKHL